MRTETKADAAPSLHQIMNDIAGRLDAIDPVQENRLTREPISELEAFITLDPLLAHLNKQYQDIKQNRNCTQSDAFSALNEVAEEQEDSAWCAMQTRYLELRQDGMLMRKARQIMREGLVREELEAREQEEADAVKAEKERKKETKAFEENIRLVVRKEKDENKNANVLEWLLLFWWMGLLNDKPHNLPGIGRSPVRSPLYA